MEAMKFVGWVEKILPAGDYDQKFVVTNYRNEDAKKLMKEQKEFPNALMFAANVKNGSNSQLDDLHEGDKVEVKFFLAGRSGISKKNTYYCVNNLNIAKKDGITIVERVKVDPAGQPQPVSADDEDLDIPF